MLLRKTGQVRQLSDSPEKVMIMRQPSESAEKVMMMRQPSESPEKVWLVVYMLENLDT